MSTKLLDTVSTFIERHSLLTEGESVVVGASGGVDSMVCLAVLRRLGHDVHAFHVNYGLRDGADADEALVRQWCKEQSPAIDLKVTSLDAKAYSERKEESLQAAARRLRYDALAEHAEDVGAVAVATGHHRDDQAETLLLNLVRGSGPEGLAGMRPSRPLEGAQSIALVRPLLDVSREAIEQYAADAGIPWRTDPTNRSLKYDRGIVRTEVLPLLERHFEGARDTIARSAELMREYVDQALRPALADRLERAYSDCVEGGWLSLEELQREPPVWRRRIVLEALRRSLPEAPQSYDVAEEVSDLVDRQVGRRIEMGGGTVWRERGGLRFLPEEAQGSSVASKTVPWGEEVDLPHGTLRVEVVSRRPESLDSDTKDEVYADADRLGTGLTVRSWSEGDRIQPLGLDGTKKVSAVLTEDRVPSHRRVRELVVCTEEHVAWVVGHRLDRRVRVRPGTERVARLVLRRREKASDGCQSS